MRLPRSAVGSNDDFAKRTVSQGCALNNLYARLDQTLRGRSDRREQRQEANFLRRVGPKRAGYFGLRAQVETTDARKAAALVPSSDVDLLLQCPRITKAEGGHIANACSRLATKSYASMPAPLRLPARRDEPVSAG